MSVTDIVLAVVILAAAAWLLYRSLGRGQGGCHGCSGGGCGARRHDPAPLVRLGGRRR